MQPMAARRVLIADDDPSIRRLLRELVESAGFVVVGEAANGVEAVRLAAELQPDVITMDLEMPVLNGVEATRRICADGCPPVVIVSGSQSSELTGAALAAGARWHVAKSDAAGQLVPVLRALAG
jgi:CheY-like chemotaxis protein